MRVKIPSIAFRRVFAACILLLTVIMLIWPQSSPLFSSLNRDSISYISGSILSVENEHLTPSSLPGGQMLGEQTLRVALDNGQTVTLTNYLTGTHNILATVGMRVVVCVDAPEGVEPYYTLYQYDRTAGVVAILAIFLV